MSQESMTIIQTEDRQQLNGANTNTQQTANNSSQENSSSSSSQGNASLVDSDSSEKDSEAVEPSTPQGAPVIKFANGVVPIPNPLSDAIAKAKPNQKIQVDRSLKFVKDVVYKFPLKEGIKFYRYDGEFLVPNPDAEGMAGGGVGERKEKALRGNATGMHMTTPQTNRKFLKAAEAVGTKVFKGGRFWTHSGGPQRSARATSSSNGEVQSESEESSSLESNQGRKRPIEDVSDLPPIKDDEIRLVHCKFCGFASYTVKSCERCHTTFPSDTKIEIDKKRFKQDDETSTSTIPKQTIYGKPTCSKMTVLIRTAQATRSDGSVVNVNYVSHGRRVNLEGKSYRSPSVIRGGRQPRKSYTSEPVTISISSDEKKEPEKPTVPGSTATGSITTTTGSVTTVAGSVATATGNVTMATRSVTPAAKQQNIPTSKGSDPTTADKDDIGQLLDSIPQTKRSTSPVLQGSRMVKMEDEECLEKLICEMTNYRYPNCKDAADDPEDEDATAKGGFNGRKSEDTMQEKIPKQDEKNNKKGNKKKSDGCVYVRKYDTQHKDHDCLKEQQKTPSSNISDLQKILEDRKNKTDEQIDAVDHCEGEDVAVKAEFSGGQLEERTQEQTQKQNQGKDQECKEEKSDAYVDVNKYNTLLKDCEGLSVQQRTLSSKIFDLENTVKNKENQIDELRKIIKGLKDTERLQLREISEKRNEIEKSKLRYQNVTDECKTLRKQVEDNLSKEKEFQEKVSKSDQCIQQLNIEKNDIEKNYITIQREKSRMDKEHREQNRKIEENYREINRLKVSLREKEELITNAEKNESDIRERCQWLEQEVERISRGEIAVGFHTTLAPTMSSLVLEGLMSRLTGRLAAEKVDLVRKPYSGNTDYCWPLLVVCVNVSRIGADAKEALKGIPKGNNKDVALLVFHHKEAHALPSQTSDKILTGSDFSHLGTIIDLAFLSQKGIYECEMNTVGIERVVSFLLQYKTQRK